jgi:hypothetical protein
MSDSSRKLEIARGVGCWLVLFTLAVYLLSYSGVLRVTDGWAQFAVTENLVQQAGLDARQLDNWEDLSVGVAGLPYAKYGLGASLAMAPFYGLARLSGGRLGLAHCTMILPVLATALTAGVILATARRLGYSSRASALIGVLYGVGTIAWVLFARPVVRATGCITARLIVLRRSHISSDSKPGLVGNLLGTK